MSRFDATALIIYTDILRNIWVTVRRKPDFIYETILCCIILYSIIYYTVF